MLIPSAARPSPLSMSSTPSSARAVPSTVSVPKALQTPKHCYSPHPTHEDGSAVDSVAMDDDDEAAPRDRHDLVIVYVIVPCKVT